MDDDLNRAGDDENADLAARRLSVLGSILLFSGIGVLGLLLVDPAELPASMPRSWYLDRPLWVTGGLIAVGVGWHLLGDHGTDEERKLGAGTPRKPTSIDRLGAAGRRFNRLVLYSREGCHLCDEARATLGKYAAYLPEIMEVDIDRDPELIARFSTCVPVIELDGKVRFRGRVNELLLRRLIRATPPQDTAGPDDNL
jgi:glutaredoxin